MSIKSYFRGENSSERGFVLVSVLVIALLYFGLLELMLLESSQALRGAQRFRSRIVAQTLAENAAELAAHQFLFTNGKTVAATNRQGKMKGRSRRLPGERFEIEGVGVSDGPVPLTASVKLFGHFSGTSIVIDRSIHSQ